ncbi:MAG: tripartite tricarboxylate transporter TctB family protein [Halomonas sp.]|jgi:putative tricarboxylic transport membrane protein|uniref:Tripartite tricarboxylate transporter TctB family protein n=1 Tax=Billgrantia tianxiuensis TaxID=2497861 RepID=A0A6I6SR06_9GAMM|nr:MULTISPECIES: tripartite tricarboxylate transporter TctB family protein [Halomonas]MCE8032033.1 tripartite tricarboxylate transporter TctB family protein [Halomonas sp. MCCC 1A11057]MDX5432596.1 tripartite tricarboxylate transporter TctB family protein [Halomonas sp.]MDX5502315.1 tripartite tricarboxylate transporter TctB family protein [Halomonas sp.]QHC49925.1 tripartite tricarboxylate transporter TctB family protein [Halomonas tianxiuensis]
MTRLNTNQWLALIIAVFAAAYLWMAWQIPSFPLPRPVDSDLFPKVLGFTLLALAALLFFERPAEVVSDDEEADAAAQEAQEDAARPLLLRPWSRVVVTSLAIVAYALLLVPFGFVLASTLLGFGLSWYYGYRRHAINLAVSLGVVLTLYLTLTRAMGVYLPTGLLPF